MFLSLDLSQNVSSLGALAAGFEWLCLALSCSRFVALKHGSVSPFENSLTAKDGGA